MASFGRSDIKLHTDFLIPEATDPADATRQLLLRIGPPENHVNWEYHEYQVTVLCQLVGLFFMQYGRNPGRMLKFYFSSDGPQSNLAGGASGAENFYKALSDTTPKNGILMLRVDSAAVSLVTQPAHAGTVETYIELSISPFLVSFGGHLVWHKEQETTPVEASR